MKKFLTFTAWNKTIDIRFDGGFLKGIIFFLTIIFLHSLVENGKEGFAASTIEYIHFHLYDGFLFLFTIYIAWGMISGFPPFRVKVWKETED